ncbi:MAG: hypothetical protein IMY67_01845 [Bacteroidetes bacterium]|nr:hypothetical protein [Bacteroidota bacterium]
MLDCGLTSVFNAGQGCPKIIGTVKHLLLWSSDPGTLSKADLESLIFLNASILAADPLFVIKNVLVSTPADDAPVVFTGDVRPIQTGVTIGTDIYQFEWSQCLETFRNAISSGGDFYAIEVTTKGIYKTELIDSLDGIKSNVKAYKVKIDANLNKPVAGGADAMIPLSLTKYNSDSEMFPFVGANVDDIVQNVSVNLSSAGISDTDAVAIVTAKGCDYITSISDLTIGADLTHKFEVYVGGTVTGNTVSGGTLIPGAVTQSGNVYTHTRTAGTFAAGEIIHIKYENPVDSTENYVSNIITVTVSA